MKIIDLPPFGGGGLGLGACEYVESNEEESSESSVVGLAHATQSVVSRQSSSVESFPRILRTIQY